MQIGILPGLFFIFGEILSVIRFIHAVIKGLIVAYLQTTGLHCIGYDRVVLSLTRRDVEGQSIGFFRSCFNVSIRMKIISMKQIISLDSSN
jgi:hypothetical protein